MVIDWWRNTRALRVRHPHCKHWLVLINMNFFTNADLTDILFVYGLANGNGLAAVWSYCWIYPTRRQPYRQSFVRVDKNLAGRRSFTPMVQDSGRRRKAWTPGVSVACCRPKFRNHLLLPPERLDHMSITFCRAKIYINFVLRDFNYFSLDDHTRRAAFAQ